MIQDMEDEEEKGEGRTGGVGSRQKREEEEEDKEVQKSVRLDGFVSSYSEKDAAASDLQVMLRTDGCLLPDWLLRDTAAFYIRVWPRARDSKLFHRNKGSGRTASDWM